MKITINKQILSNSILVLLTFFTIYYPPITIVNSLHLLAVLSYIYIARHAAARNLLFSLYQDAFVLFIVFFYLTIICLAHDNIKGAIDLFIIIFECFPVCCMIITDLKVRNQNIDLGSLIIIVAFIQSIISILAFFIPSLQRSIIDWFISYGFRDVFLKMARWRLFGFSYTMAYAMPVVQASISCYCLYKAINSKPLYYLPMLTVLFSSIINARIGIVIFIVGVVFVLASSLKPKKFISVIIAVFLIYFIPTIFIRYLTNDATVEWLESGIDSIFSFINNTEYASDSYFLYVTDADKYRLPQTLVGKIFGEGHIARGIGVYATDIGYINDVWLGGFIYCISLPFIILYKTWFITDRLVSSFRSKILLYTGAIIILLAANVKGRAFAWNEIMMLWCLLYANYNYQRKEDNVIGTFS